MKTPRIAQLLESEPGMQPIAAKARELATLSRLCEAALPPELARQIRALNFKDGRIVILAANAAAAAKLKVLSTRLGECLKNGPAEVNSVSVRVQPTAASENHVASHKKSAITPAALEVLRVLHHRLGDSPAGGALAVLLAHHGVTVPGSPPKGAPAQTAAGWRRPPPSRS